MNNVSDVLNSISQGMYGQFEPKLLSDMIHLVTELSRDLEDLEKDSKEAVQLAQDLYKMKEAIRVEKLNMSKFSGQSVDAEKVLQELEKKTKLANYRAIELPLNVREKITNLRKELWSMNNPNEPYKFEDDDYENTDEVVVSSDHFNISCPITMTVMEDPVTNPDCNHSYSKRGYMQLRQGNNRPRCPVTGCNAVIQQARPNLELARKILRIQCSALTKSKASTEEYESITV